MWRQCSKEKWSWMCYHNERWCWSKDLLVTSLVGLLSIGGQRSCGAGEWLRVSRTRPAIMYSMVGIEEKWIYGNIEYCQTNGQYCDWEVDKNTGFEYEDFVEVWFVFVFLFLFVFFLLNWLRYSVDYWILVLFWCWFWQKIFPWVELPLEIKRNVAYIKDSVE